VELMAVCGKPTRRGAPCQLKVNGGRCPTHDVDLAARNAAVRASFRAHDKAAYYAHQTRAAKAGFKAAGLTIDWVFANERARLWRVDHPSEPERWAISVLESAGLNHYVREYPVLNGCSLDLAWPDAKRAVEIWGHQTKPSFGETVPRAAKQERKLIQLEEDGWRILVIDPTQDREAEAARLIAFASRSQPLEFTCPSPTHQPPNTYSTRTS
jgi:hypothetical protein